MKNNLHFSGKSENNRHISDLIIFIALLFMTLSGCQGPAGNNGKDLEAGFHNPPEGAKPRVWWHWMNGNITEDGIQKDLYWMKRAGIGGFQNFDAALNTPQIVPKRLIYMRDDWKEAFSFATRLADSLGLEMAIAGSPGWSESGGPWIKPEDGMKKVVWSAIRVKGGSSAIKIEKPSGVTGPFQNLSGQRGFEASEERSERPYYYKDVAVVAFKLPVADKSLSELGAVVTSSGGNFTLKQLTDGDLARSVLLPRSSSKDFAWIQFTFPKAQTIKAITMVGGGNPGSFGRGSDAADSRIFEASDNGSDFRVICNIPPGAILQQTIDIPVTTAKFFRIKVKNPPPRINRFAAMVGTNTAPVTPPGTEIAEIVLHPVDRIDRFEEKDAFAPVGGLDQKITRSTDDAVAEGDIIDLTDKLNENGMLDWTAPEGEWKVMRFGYSLLGITNHPASAEATGLEVDKLDPMAVKRYFTDYLDQYKDATGGLMGDKGGLQFMITDSYEAGAQNWTGKMISEFETRCGYSMIPWMPVLTGQIVKSSEASERFLWDFRKTLGEMIAEYHYDNLTGILQQYGMKRYSESHESGRAFIGDGMEVKRTAAVPMSAMWTPNIFINQNNQTGYEADIRESASVSHIYGQNLVAAESMTALGIGGYAWSYCPANLKPTADLELASGLNRFIIHCSVHQPVDDKIPGLGLGPFGQWFTRHETWSEQAVAWTTYLARSSYMLQQGKFVADVLYLYGEDDNITSLFRRKLPDIPGGYNYDFVNADALEKVITVDNGKLSAPDGMTWRVLVLDSSNQVMSLALLRKLNELVNEGAVLAGPMPLRPASLADSTDEFENLVNNLFGDGSEIHTVGKGKVYAGMNAAQVLTELGIMPDFEYVKSSDDTRLLYVHRTLPGIEIYWVNNRQDKPEDVQATFRVEGKLPEIWHPETGLMEPASYTIADRRTTVPLHLTPDDAVFVVFRNKAEQTSRTVPVKSESVVETLQGPWEIDFQTGRGAPGHATFDTLSSWSENNDNGIKYFSGTAAYHKNIDAPETWFNTVEELWLDLGDVENLAEVIVNGKSAGIVWKKPFRANITDLLHEGENTLNIKVTDLWVNRLIGDQQPDVKNKITYTTMPFYQADSPLLPSGLLGPVTIIRRTAYK